MAPVLMGIFVYLFSSDHRSGALSLIGQTIFMGFACVLFWASRSRELVTVVGGYRGSLGIVLKADSTSATLVLLTVFLFFLGAVYDLKEPRSKLFCLLMFVWEGLTIGIFLARDFFHIFILLEVATLVVLVLIMFVREKRSMYDGLIFMMINTVAVQFFLFGIGYLYLLAGTLNMDTAKLALANMERSELVLPYALIMTAIVFKCALVPLASWLPKVQGTPRAPAAVSGILSALYVKCALFLFIQFQEVFAPVAETRLFLWIGLATAIASIVMALAQTDIMLILAYSSTAQIGLMMVGLNIGGAEAWAGSLYHIVVHAICKAALFLSAGLIVKMYHTRDIRKIRGLMKRSPLLGLWTLLSILGIAGAPLFGGSISKYFMMAGTGSLLYWLMVLVNLGTLLVFLNYGKMFFGGDTSDSAVSLGKSQSLAVGVLGVLSPVMGIFGVQLIRLLFGLQVNLSLGGYLEKSVVFVVSLLIGVVLYRFMEKKELDLVRIRNAELSFRGMCASIGVFFGVLLIYLNF
jgi:multicomponent Na+:H+ antiporter subunit D